MPRIIQTIPLKMYFTGFNLDLEPKQIKNPSGNAKTSVTAKSINVFANPDKRESIVCPKLILISVYQIRRKVVFCRDFRVCAVLF